MAAVPSTDHDQEIREPLFRELNASEVKEGHLETTEIESLCINCEQNVSNVVLVDFRRLI